MMAGGAAAEAGSYAVTGFRFPIRIMSTDEMADRLQRFERIEASRAGRLPPAYNFKPHLLIPWLWDLVCDPRIVAPVCEILGPDVLCWGSSFFNKTPGEARRVPWHQDATYWGLERHDALTAWIAFTPSTTENGCLRVIPASHSAPLRHVRAAGPENMLYGQERLASSIDEAAAVDVVLAPGEMSLHHLLSIHGSEPNRGLIRRVGFAIRYIAGDQRQRHGTRGSATLISGRDHGMFDLESRPDAEFDAAALNRHKGLLRQWTKIVDREIATVQSQLPVNASAHA